MVAKVRDAKLDTPTARSKLPARGKPFYRAIGEGLHLGYRKGKADGKWVARVYTGSGSYVVETIATADDRADADGATVLSFYQAQTRAREAQGRLAGKIEAHGPYTVGKALDEYLEALEHDGRPTGDTRNRIDVHIRPDLGAVEVADLKAERVRKWMRALADAPARVRGGKGVRAVTDPDDAARRRRASTNRTLTVVKAALNMAWREGRISDDREWRSVRPFPQADAARVRYLQIAEARRLVNASGDGFRQLVRAALQTGARYGELTRLRVEDFSADAGTVHIRRSKSGKARHVILTDEGAAFFKAVTAGRKRSAVMLRNAARLERGLVADDDGAWRPSEQVREMATACARARIEPPIGFHGLRHTWASLAVMAGVPLLVVARNLGHADTRMVERHYGHLSQSYLVDAIRAGAPRFGTVEESNVARIA